MSAKYKRLFKSLGIALGIGAGIAGMFLAAVTIYLNSFDLTSEAVITAKLIKIFLPASVGVTSFLLAASIIIGKYEKREIAEWKERDIQKAASEPSYTAGLNLVGLIDDSQGKKFVTLYGEKVKPGDDHGIAFMITRTCGIITLFFTVTILLYTVCMLLSLIK